MMVFVISLLNSKERRFHVRDQMNSVGIHYQFFDAIDRHEGYRYFEAIDEKSFLIQTGRRVTLGEVACYASHLSLWKKCISLNEPLLIMEDDFYLKKNFPYAIDEVKKLINDYGYIRLQKERKGKKRKILDSGKFTLFYYTKMPHSAMCYAISPRIASVFVYNSRVLYSPVDVFVKKIWEHKQCLYGLTPYTVFDGPVGQISDIGKKYKTPKKFDIKIIRFFTKIKWILYRYVYNISSTPLRFE